MLPPLPLLLRCGLRPGPAPSPSPWPPGRWTPEEGMGGAVVLASVAQQATAVGGEADGVNVVLQGAVLHAG